MLWRFLDIAPWWAYALGVSGVVALCVGIVRLVPAALDSGVSIRILVVGFVVAFVLMLLGGQGRFLYANIDWQVRYAVLRDMGINPWPFVYTSRPMPDVLRAPIGMFFLPALAFKAWGSRAGDIALLFQNSALLGMLLAMASRLFAGTRARLWALGVFLAFSGLDAAGALFVHGGLADHLENWAQIQYSSTLTLAFWVPHHAMTAWIGALLFLLWRTGRIPLSVFLAILPLTLLWSPFGLLGTLPFVALAGIETLIRRRLRLSDIALPALSSLLCVPGLLYLGAAGDDVGIRLFAPGGLRYIVFQLFETAPYLVPLALVARTGRFGLPTFLVIIACLLLMPFVQIGWSIDFMMRASVPALTILAVMVADAVAPGDQGAPAPIRLWLLLALVIGSVTGAHEIRRALTQPPAPEVRCTFWKAWDQSFAAFPKGSYLAPLPDMPAWVRPHAPARASAVEPEQCWRGDWYRRSTG
ncbi:hypothetical protein [Sphingobium algorifonticola]|uniref:hypothetical protein n=1 Tax=Sphingobium algorifonticola TaxID=2008318 RepID=UPI001F49C843|nr:hypothetical protein [Sphingobium algorifonticola]